MKRMMERLVHGESGFTFIEMVFALAIAVILLAALAMSFSQSVITTGAANNRSAVVRNLDIAGSWLVRDFQSAQILPGSATLLPGSGSLTLVQSVGEINDSSVTYMIDSEGNLIRATATSISRIAGHVTSLGYSAGTATTPSTANVTASSGSIILTKEYNVMSRISDSTTGE